MRLKEYYRKRHDTNGGEVDEKVVVDLDNVCGVSECGSFGEFYTCIHFNNNDNEGKGVLVSNEIDEVVNDWQNYNPRLELGDAKKDEGYLYEDFRRPLFEDTLREVKDSYDREEMFYERTSKFGKLYFCSAICLSTLSILTFRYPVSLDSATSIISFSLWALSLISFGFCFYFIFQILRGKRKELPNIETDFIVDDDAKICGYLHQVISNYSAALGSIIEINNENSKSKRKIQIFFIIGFVLFLISYIVGASIK